MTCLQERTGRAGRGWTRALLAVLALAAAPVPGAAAGQPADPPSAGEDRGSAGVGRLLAGAAIGLATHEAGHLLLNVVFDAEPALKKVEFAGIPFFAITHRRQLSPRREFAIAAAGFWVQHATSEWLLSRRPPLRAGRAPVAKGLLAFDLATSVAYSGVAFARAGPPERDTRAMAAGLGIGERWVGALILAPALLDAYRYFHPESAWARWPSRGLKLGLVLLVLK